MSDTMRHASWAVSTNGNDGGQLSDYTSVYAIDGMLFIVWPAVTAHNVGHWTGCAMVRSHSNTGIDAPFIMRSLRLSTGGYYFTRADALTALLALTNDIRPR